MKKILFFVMAVIMTNISTAQPVYFGQTPPGNIPKVFAPGIISGYVHGRIAISPKGDEIFWVVNPSTERIFYSKIENGIWSKPALTDFVKDNLIVNNGGVAFSPDGKKLFFIRLAPEDWETSIPGTLKKATADGVNHLM